MKTCWLFRRRLLQAADSSATPANDLRRHLDACPECRLLLEGHRRVAEELRETAPEEDRAPSPFLTSRICQALSKAPAAASSRPEWSVYRRAAALGGALAVGMVALSLWPSGNVDHTSQPVVDLASNPMSELPPLPLDEWARSLDLPLEEEIEAVKADARSAVRLLANNFLPRGLSLGGDPNEDAGGRDGR